MATERTPTCDFCLGGHCQDCAVLMFSRLSEEWIPCGCEREEHSDYVTPIVNT